MQISAITSNYNYSVNNNVNKNNVSQTSFQGGLSKFETDIVLQRLARVNDEVFEQFNPEKFFEVVESLKARYASLGVRSTGMQVVNNKDLSKLLGKDAPAKYNIGDKWGLCVAVGDKNGPIERMTNIYQAKTFLINLDELSKLSKAGS